jgi:hypothetical protein
MIYSERAMFLGCSGANLTDFYFSIAPLMEETNGARCRPGGDVMKPTQHNRLQRWVKGAIALGALSVLCVPRSADAGCSHLVNSQSDRYASLVRLDQLVRADSPAGSLVSDVSKLDQGKPLQPRRCSGLSCSKSTPLPASSAKLAPRQVDQWGALFGPIVVPSRICALTATNQADARSALLKTAIFHPPRV